MTLGQHPTPDSTTSVDHIRNIVRGVLIDQNLTPNTPVLIAVSGGPDSLCLADAVIGLASQFDFKPVIAHLNHCLRGSESDDDASFVRDFALAHDVQVRMESAHVRHQAQEDRVSIEVAARNARYSFLQRSALELGSHHILIGHNADDQAETLLQRIIRGTGISGLRGMQVASPLVTGSDVDEDTIWLVRPLLTITRQEISDYCETRSLTPRTDSTNADLHYTRNRIRHELLPLLETMNPGIRKVLWHLSEIANSDIEIIEYATQQAFRSVVYSETKDGVMFHRKAWQALPIGLQRTTLRQAIMHVKQNTVDLKFNGIEEARDVLNSSAISGQIAILADVRIVISPTDFNVTAQPK